jgi:outer membrane protein assembly factor BamB/tetratricopeptide (TPR) repeat protein
VIWTTSVAAIFGAIPSAAQLPENAPQVYLDESIEARNRLSTTVAYLRAGKWAEAAEVLQQLIEAGAARIVRVSDDVPVRYVNLRTYCHKKLADLPAEGLRAYRDQIDGVAADLLRRAENSGDVDALRRIVDEFFCSSVADTAIDRLADDAVSAGRYLEAISLWNRLLAPEWVSTQPVPQAGDEMTLRFPDPDVDLPYVAAKRIVALLLEGDRELAQESLVSLKQRHPTAAGRLAGRTGLYWKTLSELIVSPDELAKPEEDADWLTFAGNFRRSKVAPRRIEIGDVQWSWRFRDEAQASAPGSVVVRPEDQLVYHPVVTGDHVLLASEREIITFDLATGRHDSWFKFEELNPQSRPTLAMRATHTLTVVGNRVFARSGAPVINPGFNQFNQFRRARFDIESKLYCLDFRSQRLLWSASSSAIGDGNAVFEGAPVVSDDQVLVAMTRIDAMSQAAVVALDVETGKLRWRTVVCEAPQETVAPRTIRNNLLTLADDCVYYGTNLGAVAALGTRNGTLRWVTTYQRGATPLAELRAPAADMSPSLVDSGRVFVVPTDSSRILCLDAQTGRRIWESPWPVAHLLGVAKNRLIATGNRVLAIDIATGKVAWYWPENTAKGHGRGLLAGDYVYWPTLNEIHVLDQETGRKVQPSVALFERLGVKGGNMAVGNDCLILAQADRLLAIYPYRRLIRRIRNELAENPESAELHFRLAYAAMSNHDLPLASEHFRLAVANARPGEFFEGRKLAELARERLLDALLEQAKAAAKSNRAADAERLLTDAVATAATGAEKVQVLRRAARIWREVGRPNAVVDALQRIVASPKLRTELLDAESGVRIPASTWATRELGEVIAAAGPNVYQAYDAAVRERSRTQRDPDALLELLEAHPSCSMRADLLLTAATRYEEIHRWTDARRTYLRVLRERQLEGGRRLEALAGLERVYRSQRLWPRRREVLDRLAKEFSERPMPRQPEKAVSAFVREQLERHEEEAGRESNAQKPFDQLTVVWQRRSLGDGVYVAPNGDPPGSAVLLFIQSASHRVFALPARDARPIWSVDLGGRYLSSEYVLSGLLIATTDRLVCLDYESGSTLWSVAISERNDRTSWMLGKTSVSARIGGDSIPSNAKQELQVARTDDVLLVRSGDRLTAFDVEQGVIIWDWTLNATEMRDVQLVGSIACVRSSDRLIGFDALTGSRVFELPIRGGALGGAVVAHGPRIIAATAADELSAVEIATGKLAWTYSALSPSLHAPRLFSDGENLNALIDGWQVVRLDPCDGKKVWETTIGARPLSDPSGTRLIGGRLVIVGDGWLHCLEATTGRRAWRRPMPDLVGFTQILESDGAIALWSAAPSAAALMLFNPTDGELTRMFRFERPGSEPTLYWNRCFCLVTGSEQNWLLAEPESSASK